MKYNLLELENAAGSSATLPMSEIKEISEEIIPGLVK